MTLGTSEYIFRNGDRVRFFIWESQEAYIAGFPDGKGTQAVFHPYEYKLHVDTGEIEKLNPFGEIHFVAGLYGSGVVTHECLHSCFHWAEINSVKLPEEEESFCWELGMMVSAFWKWHYRLLEWQTGLS